MAKVKPFRDAYRKAFPSCQYCSSVPATEIHEITSGPAREAALEKRESWLHLCRDCHDYLQGRPVAAQCAVKLLQDPRYFDLAIINELRGRSDRAIELSDVAEFLTIKE